MKLPPLITFNNFYANRIRPTGKAKFIASPATYLQPRKWQDRIRSGRPIVPVAPMRVTDQGMQWAKNRVRRYLRGIVVPEGVTPEQLFATAPTHIREKAKLAFR